MVRFLSIGLDNQSGPLRIWWSSILESLSTQLFSCSRCCRLDVRVVNMTEVFQSQGVPALLIYRGGSIIGNFVRFGDEFPTDEFLPCDVAKFLVEHGHLPDPSLVPKIMKSSEAKKSSPKKEESKPSRFRVGRIHRRHDSDDDE